MAELGAKESEVAVGAPAPSLLSLCLDAVAAGLTRDSAGVGAGRTGWPGGCGGGEADEDHLGQEQVAEALPWELLHRLASRLPPAALESLHHAAHARCCPSADTTAGLGGQDGDKRGIKRSRCEDFNTAWQSLFKLRWPLGVKPGHDSVVTVDWQQQYWENHLQECLDESAESALLPSFCGGIGELSISAKIMNSIYRCEDISRQHSRLTYQFSRFGCYARCLRLLGVLCTAETYDLLHHCKLERLMFIRIIDEPEVEAEKKQKEEKKEKKKHKKHRHHKSKSKRRHSDENSDSDEISDGKDERRKRVHSSPDHKKEEKRSRHEKKHRRHDSSDSDNDGPPRRQDLSEDDEPRRRRHDDDEPRRRRHDDDEPRRRQQGDDEPRRRQEDLEPRRRWQDDEEPRRRRQGDEEPRGRQHDDPPRYDRLDADDRKMRQQSPPDRHHAYSKHDGPGSRSKRVEDGHKAGNSTSEHRSRAEQGSGEQTRQESEHCRNNGPSFNRRRGGVHHMLEEERLARLRQMQADAEVHEEQRWKRLKKAADDDAKEAATVNVNQFKGKNFLEDEKKSIFGTEKGGSATIEESIRRRAFYSQGGRDAEGNAFRR